MIADKMFYVQRTWNIVPIPSYTQLIFRGAIRLQRKRPGQCLCHKTVRELRMTKVGVVKISQRRWARHAGRVGSGLKPRGCGFRSLRHSEKGVFAPPEGWMGGCGQNALRQLCNLTLSFSPLLLLLLLLLINPSSKKTPVPWIVYPYPHQTSNQSKWSKPVSKPSYIPTHPHVQT